jgi:hypothetical protein
MSASTPAIQGTAASPKGPIVIVALAAVALLAVIAIAWGALALSNQHVTVGPAAGTNPGAMTFDKGSRLDTRAPGMIFDKGTTSELRPTQDGGAFVSAPTYSGNTGPLVQTNTGTGKGGPTLSEPRSDRYQAPSVTRHLEAR